MRSFESYSISRTYPVSRWKVVFSDFHSTLSHPQWLHRNSRKSIWIYFSCASLSDFNVSIQMCLVLINRSHKLQKIREFHQKSDLLFLVQCRRPRIHARYSQLMAWSNTISWDIAFWFNLFQDPFVIDTFMKDGGKFLHLLQIEGVELWTNPWNINSICLQWSSVWNHISSLSILERGATK